MVAQIQPGVDSFRNENFDQAFDVFLAARETGNPIAAHYLGLMSYYGLGMKQDREIAIQLFYEASKNGEEGGYPEAAYWLARVAYLDPESKYYNFKEGLTLLILLKENGHPEGAFQHGVQLIAKLEGAANPQKLLEYAQDSFLKASSLGKHEAKFFVFLVEREQIERGLRTRFSNSAIDYLTKAATVENETQGEAAFELALLYKDNNVLPENLTKYVEYLEVAVGAGNKRAAIPLGRAYMIGMLGDPDYGSARFYFEFAQKEQVKGAEFELQRLANNEKEEAEIAAFEPPEDWYLQFLASQTYSSSFGSRNTRTTSPSTSSFESFSESYSSNDSQMFSFRRTGNTIRSSSGVRYRQTGNTIRGSDGSRFTISGNSIRSSNGTRYRMTGNSIRGSDGTSYRFTGNTIRGSDGTRCRTTGNTTRCY